MDDSSIDASSITINGGQFGDKTFDAIYQGGAEAAKQALCADPEDIYWEVTCENNVIVISRKSSLG